MKPYVTLLVGVLSVSFAAIFIRLADAPPLVIAAYRLSIASAILVPIAAMKSGHVLKDLSRRDMLLILLSSVFVAVHFALWITSLSYTSITSSMVLVTSHPVFVAATSYFLWGERLDKVAVGGIVVTLLGVIIINYGDFTFTEKAFWGDLLALIAGLAMGAYLIIGGQIRSRIGILPYLALIYSGAAVMLLATAMITGHSLIGYSNVTYVMMVLLALVPQLIGHSCLNLTVRLIPVTLVSVAILGEPVGATVLGYLILDEVPHANEITGGLLILVGIFTVMRRTPKRLVMK
ncbi:MAG: EamA family transporter [Dehalococcoidales bacterium]|nr:EamA family transporter [Dehalococcoidales bacterium]MDP6577302.1 DMT family transporter [Dehalococcoidales bacterium]